MQCRVNGQSLSIALPPQPAIAAGSLRVGVIGLDHGHIQGMCRGLQQAGADIAAVHDGDPARAAAFAQVFPSARVVDDAQRLFDDPRIQLIATAAVPDQRAELGCRAMRHGKDVFSAKCPFTTLEQLAQARRVCAETGRIYAVYYSERVHSEASVLIDAVLNSGALGRVLHLDAFGPHRLNAASRPAWFFDRQRSGGILADIGSHQVEQFLYFSRNTAATITAARIANHAHALYPGFSDCADFCVTGGNGATGHHRVDWLTPDGLGSWGDGRLFIVAEHGTIEARKQLDPGVSEVGAARRSDHVIIVDRHGEQKLCAEGQCGFPYFGQLLRDCLERSAHAMPQEHTFLAAELSLRAQRMADHAAAMR